MTSEILRETESTSEAFLWLGEGKHEKVDGREQRRIFSVE